MRKWGLLSGRPCLLEWKADVNSSIRCFCTRKQRITSRIVHCTENLFLRIHPSHGCSRGERVAQVQNLKRPRRGGTLARISGARFSARQCIQPHCTRSAATCLGIFEVYTMYCNWYGLPLFLDLRAKNPVITQRHGGTRAKP